MFGRACKRAASLGREFTLERARAEQLLLDRETFDTVLLTLTLCSVQDPARALSEAYRVLKPGGALLFVEHVRPEGQMSGAGWRMRLRQPGVESLAGATPIAEQA